MPWTSQGKPPVRVRRGDACPLAHVRVSRCCADSGEKHLFSDAGLQPHQTVEGGRPAAGVAEEGKRGTWKVP